MKSLIPYLGLLLLLQLCSCASQTDSVTLEKNAKKQKGRALLGQDSISYKDLQENLEELDKKEEEDVVDIPSTITTTKDEPKPSSGAGKTKNDALGGIAIEDKMEEGLSVISYSNIIENRSAEMPVQGQKVKLLIKNNHQQAMWYLMPVSGEKTMPNNGQFHINADALPPFLAKQYGTADSRLIELIYYGKSQQSFRAFYIEPGSSLLFRNYDLGSYKEGEYVPFWAIKGLTVNNKMSLEEWLPFSVVSTPDVVIHNTTESGAAKWVNISENAIFAEPSIQFIQAKGVKKHQIPVGVIR